MIKEELFNYICCPFCHFDLIKGNGFLFCQHCRKKFAIEEGIPVFLDLNNLPGHLRQQIEYFSRENTERSEASELEEWKKNYIKRMENDLNIRSGEVLLDNGTGSGYIALAAAKRGLKVIACDLTMEELLALKRISQEEGVDNNLFLVCCTAERLPFKNAIADYVVSNAVLEHLLKEQEAVTEISRVSKIKNKLMVVVPLKLKYIWPFFWPAMLIHDKQIGHLRRYDKKSLLSVFGKFSYRIKNVYYSGHFLKAMNALLMFLGIHNKKLVEWTEVQDKKRESCKYGATNICIILER